MYYIYILRCTDGSLYSGITTDVERRFSEHIGKLPGGAKYTLAHKPIGVSALWRTEERKDALKLEYRLKKLTKADKERLCGKEKRISDLFYEKLDISAYEECRIPCSLICDKG